MTETPSATLAEAYAVARGMLETAGRIVLTTHVQPDGDGIGSEVALARVLRERGSRVTILNPHPTPRRFRFLEPDPPIVAYEEGRSETTLAEADLLVVLDISVRERLGRIAPWVERFAPETLVIDHHTGPGRIRGFVLRDEEAAATAELVYRLLVDWPAEIDPLTGTALYTAIAYDTGGFRYGNTRARTHEIAADLIRRGADLATANHQLFESTSLARVRLHSRVLSEVEISEDGRVAWASVSLGRLEEVAAGSEDVEGLVESLRAIEGVDVALLFKELPGEGTKISLRSRGPADVNAFARRFGGGGHRNASGVMIEEPLDHVRDRVVPAALETFSRDRRAGIPEEG